MIKVILLDIDGVLTDGKVMIDSDGKENKVIDFKDIDAVFEFKRRGYKVGLLTGEATPITLFFKTRFKPDFFYNECKDKPAAIREILKVTGLTCEEMCFVGDGKYDVPALNMVGLAACPSNAIPEVKELAKLHLKTRGGDGCVWELLEWILRMEN